MKGIILAAGEGTRLRPFTLDNPKCMIPLENKSLFDRQVDVMKECGIDPVIAVKGYLTDHFTREDITYYENKEYDTTNMVMTLFCAEEEFDDALIISYGDIIYNREVLQAVMQSEHDISVVVDMDWQAYWSKRFENPLADAEAFSMDEDGKIKVIGQEAKTLDDVQAGYIGLMKFQGDGIKALKKSFYQAKEDFANGKKAWGSPRAFEKAYMTDLLQGMINEGVDLYATKINGGWLEIDSTEDYEVAKGLFKDGVVGSVGGVNV